MQSVTLFFILLCPADADFSARGLIYYLSGIDVVPRGISSVLDRSYSPAGLAGGEQSFYEVTGLQQEVFRNIKGCYKRIGQSLFAAGYKHELKKDRSGVYIAFTDNRSAMSWPFSNNRVRVREKFNSGNISLSGYVRDKKHLRAGITIANRGLYGSNKWLGIVQAAGNLSHWMKWNVRYSSIPYYWEVKASFKGITKSFPSEFRHKFVDGSIVVSSRILDVTVLGKKGDISTSTGFTGIPDNHVQVWSADSDSWGIKVGEKIIPVVTIVGEIERDVKNGSLGLLYSGEKYMRGELECKSFHSGVNILIDTAPWYLPGIRFDRTHIDMRLSRGLLDSWPFTPKQIEVMGDKTWTFHGTGRLTSTSATLLWDSPNRYNISLSFIRLHPDWKIYITTRPHFFWNWWDILRGIKRVETDRTRSYDLAILTWSRSFNFSYANLVLGVSQLIPMGHKKNKQPGEAPVPPEFPKLKWKKPSSIGGTTITFSLIKNI